MSLEQEFLERIEKHKGVIFKISKMYMNDSEDQKDLFQEITYQIWKAYPSFEGRSKFSTWMYRIALNTAIVFLKSEKKRSFVENEEQIEKYKIQCDDFKEEEEEEQNLKKMYKAIQQLNKIDKALILYYLENVSGKEIAENIGISEVNARVKLNRAKEKLKELINK